MTAPGTPPGAVWAGMTGLQSAGFDKLIVYDFVTSGYIGVAVALEDLRQQIGNIPIAQEEARISALETKVQALDDQKATKFVAVAPLGLGWEHLP